MKLSDKLRLIIFSIVGALGVMIWGLLVFLVMLYGLPE